MTKIEALISESITLAVDELERIHHPDFPQFAVTRVSVARDGAWCARLDSRDGSRDGVSVCVEADASDPAAAVDLFMDKISKHLGLSKG